jgi:hypothetical protein
VDNINLTFRGYDFNLLHDDAGLRKWSFRFALCFLAMWIVLGFDSTPLQFMHVLSDGLPGFLAGQKTLSDLVNIYGSFYGKEMHYSAFVIYFFLFWILSTNWSLAKVKGTRNVVYSFIGMFLAIGIFEWFWILSYGIFQNQPWVYTWQMPQLKILLQNTMFSIVGALGALYIWIDSYQLNGKVITGRNWLFERGWRFWLLVIAAVAVAAFWICYPGPAQQFSVTLENGQMWQSSRLFPQTLYTVDLNPGDAVNAGVWFYYQNDLVHAVNTIVKVIWSLLVYQLFKVKRKL